LELTGFGGYIPGYLEYLNGVDGKSYSLSSGRKYGFDFGRLESADFKTFLSKYPWLLSYNVSI